MEKEMKIDVIKNGPYKVSGKLPLKKEIIVIGNENEPEDWADGDRYLAKGGYDLCRCGKSGKKPFCDGMHAREGFNGKETADLNISSKQQGTVSGPGLDLVDIPKLCAGARFCHRSGGTWELVRNSGDPKFKEMAIKEACNCPSGRLVVCNKKIGMPIEPKFEKSISLVEDPQNKVSGPLWVKGNVPVRSADGKIYEIRNRVTLCRCGKSKNKPFCDGSHVEEKFNDGDESLK